MTPPRGLAPALSLLVLMVAGCADEEDGGDVPGTTDTATQVPTATSDPTPTTLAPVGRGADRDYWFLTIIGTLVQSPPHEGSQMACGRPSGAYAGIDLDNEALVLVRGGHDFDWVGSWVAVHEDVQVEQDASQCDLVFVYAAEDGFTWSFGDAEVTLGPHDDGVLVDGELVAGGERKTMHVNVAGPGGARIEGDVDFNVRGPWSTHDVVEVAAEGDIRNEGGYWASERP